MLNFTEEIKNEIISAPVQSRKGALCMLSAFIRTSGSVISRDNFYGFEIVTENERSAEFITDLAENIFGLNITVSGAKFDLMSGRDKLAFECVDAKSQSLLKELGIVGEDSEGLFLKFGVDESLTDDEISMISYLKGAFLGGGSCTVPEENSYSRTGYHFEIVF